MGGWIFLSLVIAFLLALIPANIAAGKGHSGGGFFAFGLFLFAPALIVALLMEDLNAAKRKDDSLQSEINEIKTLLKELGEKAVPSVAPARAINPTCPSCGAENAESVKFCDKCGTELPTVKTPSCEIDPVCPKCGAEYGYGAEFCNTCGSALIEKIETPNSPPQRIKVTVVNDMIACPKCSATMRARKTCYRCGTIFVYEGAAE
ncbi:MAG: zinc ribbon domain-containing protein [Oscillospiraceae bacterium]|jgi:DNA-directed RNA polymerase subunit M/transcription elongation factor TFIIS|nr:zinc ribbon domain-containing protein [Oscillospiraceae bacterium]